MEYSLCSPVTPSILAAIYSSDLLVICGHWSRAGAWLRQQHSLLSVDGQCSLHSTDLPTGVVVLPGVLVRHPWSSIHAASWDLTLERVFHVPMWKYCFFHCIDTLKKILFYFGWFFTIKVKPFSCRAYNTFFFKKQTNPPKKTPKHCPCPWTHLCFREASCDTLWKREMWYRKNVFLQYL